MLFSYMPTAGKYWPILTALFPLPSLPQSFQYLVIVILYSDQFVLVSIYKKKLRWKLKLRDELLTSVWLLFA